MYVSNIGHHWFIQRIVAWSAPTFEIEKCCSIVNWRIRNNFREISITIQNKIFHARKCFWKCRLPNGCHFVSNLLIGRIHNSLRLTKCAGYRWVTTLNGSNNSFIIGLLMTTLSFRTQTTVASHISSISSRSQLTECHLAAPVCNLLL